jgi:type IV secretory pathway TraG/TraD family ATPase VirD4
MIFSSTIHSPFDWVIFIFTAMIHSPFHALIVLLSATFLVILEFFPHLLKKRPKNTQRVNPKEKIDSSSLGKCPLLLARFPKVVLGEEARYQHMQVVGASGTGKTRDGILPYIYQDVRNGAGIGVLDVKSNLSPKIAAFAQKKMRQNDFLRFELKDPEHSLTYNPLVGDDPTEVANRLWTALYQDDNTATPFYREAAMNFLRNFFGICHKLEALATFKQLRQVAADQQALDIFTSLAPQTDQAKTLKQRYGTMTKTEYIKLFEGLVNKLAPFCDGPFAKLLNTTEPQINLREVVAKGEIVIFGLAADLYPADYKVLSTLILMDLHSSLTPRYQSREHKGFFLYLDEVADFVFPGFRALVAKAREARVGLILAHQAQGDLKAVSDAFMDSVMSSTSNKVIFRLGTSDTAEQFARLIGTKTVIDRKTNYSLQGGGAGEAKGYTDQKYEEFLIHPNELKNLAVGEAAFIVQREDGRRVFKAETWTDEERQFLYKAQPEDRVLYRRPEGKSHKPLVIEAPAYRLSTPAAKPPKGMTSEIMGLVSGKNMPRKTPKQA